MSRKADPSWTIPTWAPDTNYGVSADPWSATPTKVTHPGAASVGITPKTAVPAQVINKLLADAYSTDSSAKTSIQGLYDLVGQSNALNWYPGVTATSVADVFWNAALEMWVYAGGTDVVKYSGDGGLTWSSSSEVAGVAATHLCYTGAADPSGNMVVLTDSTSLYDCTAGTWANRSGVLFTAPTSAENTQVLYEPVSGTWCAHWINSGLKMATSTNRSVWTSRLGSTNMGSVCGMAVNPTTGRILAVSSSSSTSVYVSKSDNGGVAWADLTTLTADFTTAALGPVNVYFEEGTSTWWICIGLSSSLAGNIWKSTDEGATWTKVLNATDFSPGSIIADGPLLIVRTKKTLSTSHPYKIVYSVDSGATWRYSDAGTSQGSGCPMKFNGSRILVAGTSLVHASHSVNHGRLV